MYIFHGTTLDAAIDIMTRGVDLTKSNERLDFGPGYYTTDNRVFAERTARYRTKKVRGMGSRQSVRPAVVTLECCELNDEELLREVRLRKFVISGISWLEFVIVNRCSNEFVISNQYANHNKDFKYDIVLGPTADGGIAAIAADFEKRRIKIEADLLRNILPSYGTQISFHTVRSLACIKPIKYDIID